MTTKSERWDKNGTKIFRPFAARSRDTLGVMTVKPYTLEYTRLAAAMIDNDRGAFEARLARELGDLWHDAETDYPLTLSPAS